MPIRLRAFTLAELLVVLAILLLLAGVLFPVINSVKESSRRAVCLENFHQAQLATYLYVTDYDDRFMPVNHRPGGTHTPRLDRTWVQLVLPYVRSFAIFRCPSDYSPRQHPETGFDADLVPGDVYAQYYTASLHVNMGYNYLYLSPIVRRNGAWVSEPRIVSNVGDPSRTLLFVDSLWSRSPKGEPIGGGNWLVVPPCRYRDVGPNRIDTFAMGDHVQMYTPVKGWDVDEPFSPTEFGGAWPWHSGRVNVAYVDGSVHTLSPQQLTTGCNVKEDWFGTIQDPGEYRWDLE